MHFDLTHFRLPKRPATPGVRSFATLGGIEAVVRGSTLSVYPVLLYRAFGDAVIVSQIYFCVGILSLITGLMIPGLTRLIARRWVYTLGVAFYLISATLGMIGGGLTAAALLFNAMGAATCFVCYNAYVMDNIPKPDLSRLESLRLFYGGIGWSVGPFLGVLLVQVWHGLPFVIVFCAASVMMTIFWVLRLGNGRIISRAKAASPNPFVYLRRFFSQPRLIASWFFVVIRSSGWWVFIVYVGIFSVQNGMSESLGGIATSTANSFLFVAPLMLRWVRRQSVRHAVRTGFLCGAICFILGTVFAPFPQATVVVMIIGAFFLVLLDICGGLPFMMSVKPSERTEMSAVYSSFRDVSGILTPGLAWFVLQFTTVSAVFAACGLLMLLAWAIAGTLHPQLGMPGAERARQRSRLQTSL
jgi:ACDE family multidrug resistance protein